MMMVNFSDLIQIGDVPVSITSTSLETRTETANRRQGLSRASELVLVLGLLLTVGTGGFARPAVAQSSPSSSQIWVNTKHVSAQAGVSSADDIDDVSAPARIADIRSQLSLNVKQVADAMQVGRPAVYNWLQGTTPREAQQFRLKALHDIAQEWKTLSDIPVGKYLIAPLKGGDSLMGLLRAPKLDHAQISQVMERISANIRAAESRKHASGYRSAASVMKDLGINPDSKEVQQQRVKDAADFG